MHYLPFYAEYKFCLAKALAANFLPSLYLSISKTAAKVPLPNFLTALNRL